MRRLTILTILAVLTMTAIAAGAVNTITANAPVAPKRSVYMSPLILRAEGPNQYQFDDKVNLRDADIARDGSIKTGSREGACELRTPYTTDGLIYTVSANWTFTGVVTMEISATGRPEDYKPVTNGVPADYSNFMPGSQLRWRAKLGPGSSLTEVKIVYTDLSGVAGSFGNPDLSGFTVKKEIYVKGSPKGPLYNFQIPIKVGESHKAADCDAYLEGQSRSDLSDIRFTQGDGETSLAYYRESVTGTKPDREAVFWVKIPEIPKDGLPIYMYYGKADAADLSDGEKVFDFFDDFSDNHLDIKKWRTISEGSHSRVNTSGSVLNIDAAKAITTHYDFEDGVIEYRAKVSGNGGIGGIILAGQAPDSDLMAYSSIMAASAHCIMQGPRVITNDPKQIELDRYYNFRVNSDRGEIVFQRYGNGWDDAPQAEARCSLSSGLRASAIGLSAGTGGSGLYCEWIRTRKYADPLPQIDKNKTGKEETVSLPVFDKLTLASDGNVILAEDAMEGVYTSATIRAPFDARIITTSWTTDTSDPAAVSVSVSTAEGGSYYTGWQNGVAKYASKNEFQKGSELRYKATIAKKIGTVPFGDSPNFSSLKLFSLAYYPGEIKILLPRGGEAMSPGSRYNIFWDAQGYEPTYDMDLYYSKDGGNSFTPIAPKILNSGSYTWALPDEEIAKAVIKVADPYDKGVYGLSNSFVITKSAGGMIQGPEGEGQEGDIGADKGKEGEAGKDEGKAGETAISKKPKIKDESLQDGNRKLYDLLIKNDAAPGTAADLYQNGDIVAIRPAGFLWGANERNSPIIRMYLTDAEVEEYTKPQEETRGSDPGGGHIKKMRRHGVDLKRKGVIEKRETAIGGQLENVPLVNKTAVVDKQ